jgi:hypothetical protein
MVNYFCLGRYVDWCADRGRRAVRWNRGRNRGKGCDDVGVPTSPPCGEEGLGDELGSELTTGVLERCGVGLLCC